jgi:hypothetical protein
MTISSAEQSVHNRPLRVRRSQFSHASNFLQSQRLQQFVNIKKNNILFSSTLHTNRYNFFNLILYPIKS